MDIPALLPKTAALAAYIESCVDRMMQPTEAGARADGLLFLGNWNDTTPRVLLYDASLEPLDIVVWMLIKTHSSPSAPTAFPSYKELTRYAKCSNPTLARALAVLRLTRWLTLCARVRLPNGQFRGNVYALHDEPLPLFDTLHLDAEYMPFVTEMAAGNTGDRLTQLARDVMSSIEADIDHDAVETLPTGVNRLSARLEVTRGHVTDINTQSFYAVKHTPSDRVKNFNSAELHHDNNFNTVRHIKNLNTVDHVKNFNTATCSSSCSSNLNINKKTTTTTTPAELVSSSARTREASVPVSSIAYTAPKELSANELVLVPMYLKTLDPALQQDVLDELGGRIRFGGITISNRLGYMKRLCAIAQAGEIVLTSVGVKYRVERETKTTKTESEKPLASSSTDPLIAAKAIAELKRVARTNTVSGGPPRTT